MRSYTVYESDARELFEKNNRPDSEYSASWDDLRGSEKGMVGLEFLAIDWAEVDEMRESDFDAVDLFVRPESVDGLDANEVFEFTSGSDVSEYVRENVVLDSNIGWLFDAEFVDVDGVSVVDSTGDKRRYLAITCRCGMEIF